MTDTVLVLAWLVLAHLVADFVLQNDWIALNKGTGGRTGWAALGTHGAHVGLCLSPLVLVYGVPGVVYIAVVVASHVAVDRWKVRATRRAERAALEAARARLAGTGEAPGSGLGSAWTPWPGMLFLADQLLHITIALVAWLVICEGVPFLAIWVDLVNAIVGSWDPAVVHAVVLTLVVLVALFIVNTRAAYYFVLALVSPRELPDTPPVAEPAPAVHGPSASTPAATGYTLRVGPLVATVEPGVAAATGFVPAGEPDTSSRADSATVAPDAPRDPEPEHAVRTRPAVPSGAPMRIGATIGALERLLITAFVLVGAEAAVGFVIAAKTIARFKQLDDRGFAEYYLLGTLASVSVALGSAIVAKAALGTLP